MVIPRQYPRRDLFCVYAFVKEHTDRDKNKPCDFKLILAMYNKKTVSPYLVWMLILPDFKSFVKALNFHEIQGGFTIIFSGIF